MNALLLGEDVGGGAIWFSLLLLLPQESAVGHKQYRVSLRESRKQEGTEGMTAEGGERKNRFKSQSGIEEPQHFCAYRGLGRVEAEGASLALKKGHESSNIPPGFPTTPRGAKVV